MKSLYTCKAASVLAEEVPLRGNETARPIESKKIKLLVLDTEEVRVMDRRHVCQHINRSYIMVCHVPSFMIVGQRSDVPPLML